MAKRVNKGFVYFLVGISVAVAGLFAMLLLYQTRFHGHSPKQWVVDGDAAMAKGDAEKAAALYSEALGSDPDNTEILLKFGTAMERLTPKDPQNLGKAMTAWNKAVSVNPRYVPALEKLLAVYIDQQEVNPRPELFVALKGVCDKILTVRPDDLAVAGKKQVAVISQWLSSQSPSSDEVRESIENKIPELLKKDPGNGDLIKALAQARAHQAREMVDTLDTARAHLTLREALEMVDAARKGKEQNESVQFRAFQAYSVLRHVDPDAKAREKEYNDRMDGAIDAARAVAEKSDPAADPLCNDVIRSAADWATRRGSPEKAELIVSGFYDKHKDDPRARLDMARLLARKQDPDSRAKARDLLSRDVPVREDVGGFKALLQRELQAQTVEELIKIELDEYTASADAARRKKLAEQMDGDLDKLRHIFLSLNMTDPEPVLDLEGQIHLAKGEDVEAVKSFQQAAGPVNPTYANFDLLFRLAKAYRGTGQPGLAKQRLDQIIAKVDDAIPARLLLLQMAIDATDLQGATEQLNKLQQLAPDSPDVKKYAGAVAMMNHSRDPAAANEIYKTTPETNREQRMGKAQIALALAKPEEAVRLLQDVLKEAPGDPQATLSLASVYAGSLGQKETAKRVIAEALRLHPEDPSLVIADARMHDELPEVVYDRAVKAVQKTADPFVRESQMYELESGPGGHPEQAFGHLLAAHNAKPDDAQVTDRVFGYYLNHAEFDKAEPLLEKLTSQNADKCGGLMYRFRFTMAKGDLAAAEDLGRRLTREYGDFAASWLVTAQVLQARGKLEEARDAYLDVLKRQPRQYEAYQGLVDCYYRLNDPPQAKLRLEEARKLFPDDYRFREEFLNHLVNYGEATAAVPEREKILELNTRRQRDTADDYLSLAKAYFHAAQEVAPNKAQDAGDKLNKAFEALAKGKEKFPQEPRFYSQLAEMFQYNRDLAQGEQVLREFYDRPDFKEDPEPPLLLYDFFNRAGKLDLAERYLNEAVVRADKKGDPRAVEMRLRLASLYAAERKFPDAYAALDAVPSAVRGSPLVARQRIEIQIAEGKRAEARKALEAELAKRDSADLGNLLASLMIDDRQLPQALQQLDHVLTLDPRNDAAVYLQSLAYAQQGDVTRGINQLIGLRNHDPMNGRVRLLLAELYEKNGRPDASIRELTEALEKLPINKEIRQGLIRLYRGQRPMTNQAWESILNLCRRAEADPVLGSDPAWMREEALALSDMDPPDKYNSIDRYQKAVKLSGDNPEFRREFVDLLLKFKDYLAVMVETDRLLKDGRNDWWLHRQRALALANQQKKAEALAEFDKSLDLINKQTDFAGAETILREMASAVGPEAALQRLAPLTASDPDGRWRLLQASLLRSKNDFEGADRVVSALLADPANKSAERRIPLLRAKTDIWENRPVVEKFDRAKAVPAYMKARDAYVELLGFLPEDMAALNNLAYLLSEQIPEPEGGPRKAREYSARAYDLTRYQPAPNVQVLDTYGWVLVLCGGNDAVKGQQILEELITKRQDTKTFIEGRYHLGEAYLRAAKANPAEAPKRMKDAQKWLEEARSLIAQRERNGGTVDPSLKDKVQDALAKATGPVTESN